MEKQKHYSPQEKVKILLEYFEEQPSISSLCQKYNIHPNSFYQWKKELFENADSIFVDKRYKKSRKKDEEKLEKMEKKLKEKDRLISEIVEENMQYKKKLNGEI